MKRPLELNISVKRPKMQKIVEINFSMKNISFRWNGCSQQYFFDKMIVKWIDLFGETTYLDDFVKRYLLKNSPVRSNGHGILIVKRFFCSSSYKIIINSV